MELPFTSADRMGGFAIGLGRSIYGDTAFEQLEKSGLTIIEVTVLRRLLLMAGFTAEEIERAQETGTTRALTNKLMSTPTMKTLLTWPVVHHIQLQTAHNPLGQIGGDGNR